MDGKEKQISCSASIFSETYREDSSNLLFLKLVDMGWKYPDSFVWFMTRAIELHSLFLRTKSCADCYDIPCPKAAILLFNHETDGSLPRTIDLWVKLALL
jgi:hypothetical protein